MNILNKRERLTTLATAVLLSLLCVRGATAADLNISDTPLFLSTGVKPNLIMAIDDSGSMDFEVLLPGNDGAAWWRTGGAASGSCGTGAGSGVNSFTGCIANGTTDIPSPGVLNFNNRGEHTVINGGVTTNNVWKKYAYLFPNGNDGTNGNINNRRRLGDSTNDHFAIPPLPAYAWARSPEYNKAYFNPATVYEPWPDGGGYDFENSPPTAARWDPVFPVAPATGQAAINLTQDFAGVASVDTATACNGTGFTAPTANYYFRVHTGMTIPAGMCIRASTRAAWEVVRGTGCVVGPTNGCLYGTGTQAYTLGTGGSVAIRYFPATFYLSTSTAPAEFGYSAIPLNDGLAPNGTTVLYRYEIKPGNFSSTAAYDAAIQNFANWFTYYRKRHQALRAGLGLAFNDVTATRVAGFTINSATLTGPNVTMRDIDDADDREDLYENFYRHWVASGGTPNRLAVANLIRNFRRDGDADTGKPITASCQRNFGMLFTDGFSNPPAAGDGINAIAGGNADGSAGAPYQDGTDNTMADAVYQAYNTPLRSADDFPLGRVKPPDGCEEAEPSAKLDCETDLHMNFYAITLGARGLQFNPDADPEQDPYATAPTWPTTFPARHPSAVDDLWHATINGRGKLLNAKSSTELADKLGELLKNIAEDKGSASSAAVNSGSINSDTRLFQASFDAADWSGNITGRSVNPMDGALGTEISATIPGPDDREIFTVDGNGDAVAFTWDTIGATRQGELDPDADTFGDERVAWLRGSHDGELVDPTQFRARTKVLGDVINSAPAFVGAPAFRYSDTLESQRYSTFRSTHANRTHMLYVGANDGMLHGFSSDDTDANDDGVADDGPVTEVFAFIPSAVFKNLHLLTSPTYSHRFYVDGSPVTGDAFVGGAWRTILVGGLNKGGQEIFALDVTEPSVLAAAESNAASILKWEFTDADDADLGYTYARPSIIRLNNGTWAAGFGNGYNSTVADGAASTTGDAVLFIRDLDTGGEIAKISTGVGMDDDPAGDDTPNGLSTPVFIDIDGDSDVDIAYAGDLFGNLWKFDLTSSNPSDWSVSNDAPFFVAMDENDNRQPITSRPNVARGPKGVGFVVLFGTGQYLESDDTTVDNANQRPQSFYGLLDPNEDPSTDPITDSRDSLLEQEISMEVYNVPFPPNTANIRITTDRPLEDDDRGWYIDLVSPALGYQHEMQVTDSLIRNDHVVFTTLVPTQDPCDNGGTSWLMELSLFSGRRPANTPWDLNDNGLFDDTYTTGGVTYPISGVQTTVGITPKPAGLAGEKCDYLIFPGTSGGTEKRCRDPGPRGFGRQSWRQAH